MAAVNSDIYRIILGILTGNTIIQNNIAKDVNNHLSIRPNIFNPEGAKFPQICINVTEGESEAKFPTSHDSVNITVWEDQMNNREWYKSLKQISDEIISLFNRKGDIFNNIDVPTNTGVRVCRFLKQSVTFDFDVKKYYVEIIFNIVRSETESFASSDAGNKAWV